MKRFKFPILMLTPLLLVSLLMVGVIYASSADQKAAGPYKVTEPSVLAGPPTQQGGNLVIKGSISNIEILGTIVGSFDIEFTCVLGVNGAQRKCHGVQTITGTFDDSAPGTLQNALVWTAGGDANFTDGTFELIEGSGTGGLADLVEFHGIFQRDGDRENLWGFYSGEFKFQVEIGDLSGFALSELFQMEEAGEITTEELIAELERRTQQ